MTVTEEQIAARRREWASRGGKAGTSEAKRLAALKAWSNPDPAKRPGRKAGKSPWKRGQQGSTTARGKTATMGDDFNRVMEQLRGE